MRNILSDFSRIIGQGIVNSIVKDFERNGISLEQGQKYRLGELQKSLTRILGKDGAEELMIWIVHWGK